VLFGQAFSPSDPLYEMLFLKEETPDDGASTVVVMFRILQCW